MPEIVVRDTSFVTLLNSALRYSATFASEHNVTFSQAMVTDVVEDLMSSHYLPAKSR